MTLGQTRISPPRARSYIAAAIAICVVLWTTQTPRAATIQFFTATLSGGQQVPAVASAGTGTGTVMLNAAEDQITVNLSFSGLTSPAILGHIHGPGAAGTNAAVLFDFAAVVPKLTAGTIPPQTFAITPAQVNELKAGLYYFNVHSNNFPNGEIRGQIGLAAVQFSTTLSGAQQVPPVVSGGTGIGTVALNAAENLLFVNLSFSGLTSPAILAHIHGPAAAGTNAAVLFDFAAVVPNATSGSIPQQTFAITPAQVNELKAGLYYFNVHSGNFPNGEIRGQIGSPVITTQPANRTINPAANATFTVVAAATPAPTYQWQISNDGVVFTNLTDVAPYSGVTTPALMVTAADLGLTGSQYRVVVTNSAGSATSNAATLTVTTAAVSLDRAALQFAATNSGAAFVQQTQPQTVRILQTGAGTVAWTATPNQPWITVSPTSGTGSATLTVSVAFNGSLPVSGSSSGAIALAFTGSGNSAGPIGVGLTTIANGASAMPFGAIDTPVEGSAGVTGSIAVTGWALDDLEVLGVRILRDAVAGEGAGPIFIGNAVFIDGARPDVVIASPTSPRNTRSGWGYMLLTNFLPNQGNGTFRLHAVADDAEGHAVDLGTKTITCANATAVRPFGAIDTPAQGEVISGTVPNFGWVLARTPALAFPPHGTVRVLIDGMDVGTPGGWVSRVDLTAAFPEATYPGIASALGVRTINTTTLANGVHTIAWIVTADNGRTDGVGSRYFTVANGLTGSLTTAAMEAPMASLGGTGGLSPSDEVNAAPIDRAPLSARRGFDAGVPFAAVPVAASGRATVQAEEMDRVEVRLGAIGAQEYAGYLRVGGDLAPLPIGSHLDPGGGVFTWQPGVGFVHAYDLVFVRRANGRAIARRELRIVLNPKSSNRVGAQVMIDIPSAGANVVQPFVVAGWAIDLDDPVATGIDTLHVWAYPAGGGLPIFVGATAYGGARPDVAALFGARFRPSGYGVTVEGLPPNTYDLAVFAWSAVEGRFLPARLVRVTVR